jgi:hypothetical protein
VKPRDEVVGDKGTKTSNLRVREGEDVGAFGYREREFRDGFGAKGAIGVFHNHIFKL